MNGQRSREGFKKPYLLAEGTEIRRRFSAATRRSLPLTGPSRQTTIAGPHQCWQGEKHLVLARVVLGGPASRNVREMRAVGWRACGWSRLVCGPAPLAGCMATVNRSPISGLGVLDRRSSRGRAEAEAMAASRSCSARLRSASIAPATVPAFPSVASW